MAKADNLPTPGDHYQGVLLETCHDKHITRRRVKPVTLLPEDMRVEFPRHLREENPVGTQFRADVKVCQKHFSNGHPNGPPYLRADTGTIVTVSRPIPKSAAPSARDVPYHNPLEGQDFLSLREQAFAKVPAAATTKNAVTTIRIRNELVKSYALARSLGSCEGCRKAAPFLSKNGQPYLEVHHLTAVSAEGIDYPTNVAAICPNCHARVTHGADAAEYNENIRTIIAGKENVLSGK